MIKFSHITLFEIYLTARYDKHEYNDDVYYFQTAYQNESLTTEIYKNSEYILPPSFSAAMLEDVNKLKYSESKMLELIQQAEQIKVYSELTEFIERL